VSFDEPSLLAGPWKKCVCVCGCVECKHTQLYPLLTLAHFSCFPELSIHRVFIISCLPSIAHHNHKEGLLTSKKAKRRVRAS